MSNGRDNLVPLTTEKAREIGKAGGIASGKARKEKKILTSALLELLKKGETIQNINTALLDKAITGDTKAFEVIRDTIGEKPVDVKEVTGIMSMEDSSDEAFAEMRERVKK
jgi:hypothetical protein